MHLGGGLPSLSSAPWHQYAPMIQGENDQVKTVYNSRCRTHNIQVKLSNNVQVKLSNNAQVKLSNNTQVKLSNNVQVKALRCSC